MKIKMLLGDIYIKKDGDELIQIDSYAHYMGEIGSKKKDIGMLIIFRIIDSHNGVDYGSCPSFNGYAYSHQEIEEEYELLISRDELNNYNNWDEVFEYVKTIRQNSDC